MAPKADANEAIACPEAWIFRSGHDLGIEHFRVSISLGKSKALDTMKEDVKQIALGVTREFNSCHTTSPLCRASRRAASSTSGSECLLTPLASAW